MTSPFVTSEDVAALGKLSIYASALNITDHEACAVADAFRRDANKLRIDIDKRRKAAKAPHQEAGKLVDQQAKVLIDPLKAVIHTFDQALAGYARACELERLKAMEAERIAAEAAAKEAEVSEIPAATTTTPIGRVDMSAPVKTHKVQVVEYYDESAIPDEFWVIDEVALRAALKAGQVVPGARLVEQRKVG